METVTIETLREKIVIALRHGFKNEVCNKLGKLVGSVGSTRITALHQTYYSEFNEFLDTLLLQIPRTEPEKPIDSFPSSEAGYVFQATITDTHSSGSWGSGGENNQDEIHTVGYFKKFKAAVEALNVHLKDSNRNIVNKWYSHDDGTYRNTAKGETTPWSGKCTITKIKIQ